MNVEQHSDAAVDRVAAIDWLKGLAIVLVVGIHARPIAGTVVHDYLVNRAVPLFLVAFGMTSALWWQRRRESAEDFVPVAGDWYRRRLLRLLVPYWAFVAAWLPIALVTGLLERPLAEALAAPTGYLPSAGTTWFVTLILQFVLFFPLLAWVRERLGDAGALALGAVATVASHLAMLPIIETVRSLVLDTASGAGFYYFWIFWPADLWLVFAGMALARVPRLPTALVVVCAALLATGAATHALLLEDPLQRVALLRIVDVPLAVVVLAGLALLSRLPTLAAALSWLGRWSWGLYLAHVLVHEAVHAFGGFPEEGAASVRWLYFFALLASAILIATLGERIRLAARDLPLLQR